MTVWAKEQPRFAGEDSQDAMVSWKLQPPKKPPKYIRDSAEENHETVPKQSRRNKKRKERTDTSSGTGDKESHREQEEPKTEVKAEIKEEEEAKPVVYQRYYHLFYKGELDDLFARIPSLTVDESGEEAGNYFIVATKH